MKKLFIILLVLGIAIFGVKKVVNFVGTAAGKTVSAIERANTAENRAKVKSAAQSVAKTTKEAYNKNR